MVGVKKGIYEYHWGGKIGVYGTARYSEDPDAIFVIYKILDSVNDEKPICVEPIELFVSNVREDNEVFPRYMLKAQMDNVELDGSGNTYEDLKGSKFEYICEAKNKETEDNMVVYKAIFKSKKYGDYIFWITMKDIFYGAQETVDGKIPRFRKTDVKKVKTD